jgi:hypothetical protein
MAQGKPMLMETPFPENYASLQATVGDNSDPSDEHERYAVYRSIICNAGLRSLLLECLSGEPNRTLVTSVLAELIEATDAADWKPILDAAPQIGAEWLRQRADETALVRRIVGQPIRSEATEDDIARLIAGTDWLQRRVAEEASSAAVLQMLSERGRTRRVRTVALERRQWLIESPLLERLTKSGGVNATAEDIERLLTSSDQLQRRVAVEGTEPGALQALAQRGRTHRIRVYARDRLLQIERAGSVKPSPRDRG